RNPPGIRQLQGGGEQQRGIHTPKLPDQPPPPDQPTHTKQRKAYLFDRNQTVPNDFPGEVLYDAMICLESFAE
ncbi:hypothetical protein, partial [Bifidobacterium sp.]|uniref:hypothetical protein n=1 Tax=Bifidobacterium sp. TaxID=41200 RepID=UPI0025C64FE3